MRILAMLLGFAALIAVLVFVLPGLLTIFTFILGFIYGVLSAF